MEERRVCVCWLLLLDGALLLGRAGLGNSPIRHRLQYVSVRSKRMVDVNDLQLSASFLGVFGLRGVASFALTSPRSPLSTSSLSSAESFLILRKPVTESYSCQTRQIH